MTEELQRNLSYVNQVLTNAETYDHAVRIINYDQETICPPKAMEEQGHVMAVLQNQAFRLRKDPEFIRAGEYLFQHIEELGDFDQALAKSLHRDYLRTKHITPELQHEFDATYNQAFIDWLNAKKQSDFSVFAPSLQKVRDVTAQQIRLREEAKPVPYDNLLDDYEPGIDSALLDQTFAKCRDRLVPLLRRIEQSPKKIRTDFLSRPVTDEQQRQMTDYLLDVIGFDKTRGSWTLTEHPFTDGLWADDNRITTHFDPNAFASSMFSVIHEGGHALFEMMQPRENYAHHIFMNKTMGMHESVSRFYENRLGRSRAFVHLIYPKTREIFPQAMEDVSEEELYEALNVVQPSLIRTEADEFTYTFHIMIRYELEKLIVNTDVKTEDLPGLWNRKYEEYFGIRPANDREGILQDVHWSEGFGYFFSYAIGNMYNAMYYNRMKEDLDVDTHVRSGDFGTINKWMADHVFKKADRKDSMTWIREITGRDFTPDDFLDYLEEKYSALYEL